MTSATRRIKSRSVTAIFCTTSMSAGRMSSDVKGMRRNSPASGGVSPGTVYVVHTEEAEHAPATDLVRKVVHFGDLEQLQEDELDAEAGLVVLVRDVEERV